MHASLSFSPFLFLIIYIYIYIHSIASLYELLMKIYTNTTRYGIADWWCQHAKERFTVHASLYIDIDQLSTRTMASHGICMGKRWKNRLTWWRHQMETFSALLAICAGNSVVTGEFPHKGQWRGALVFPLICAWINGWVNNGVAGDLRRHRVHYYITVMDSSLQASLKEITICLNIWTPQCNGGFINFSLIFSG